MTALYEISDKVVGLKSLKGDLNEDVFNDTLESLIGPLDEKIIGCAIVSNGMDNDVSAIDAVVKRLTERKKHIQNNQRHLKEYMMFHMKKTDVKTIKDPLFTVKVNKGRESVEITDPDKLPVDCYEPQPPKISKTKVKEMLQKGRQIDGAQMVRHESLSIR